jgi:hypothetical protein
VLRRARITQSDLSSFTVSSKQSELDTVKELWNDVISLLYSAGDLPKEMGSSTITLLTSTSAYDLAADFEIMEGDPVDSTNNQILKPYPGGWLKFREDVPDVTDYTGLPTMWMIRDTDGKLLINTSPNSEFNGRVYTYVYRKRINMSATTDTFPFSDTVVDLLVAPVVQAYSLDAKERFVNPLFVTGLALAAQAVRQQSQPDKWGVVKGAAGKYGWPYDE